MTTAKADSLIRSLAVVVGGFGLFVIVAVGMPLVFSLVSALSQPPSDQLAIRIFTFVIFAAMMGCFVAVGIGCVVAAWRVWRQPPSRPNVRLLSALTATMLWLIASTIASGVLRPSSPDTEIGSTLNLLNGILAVAAMCFHGWLSRRLIARSPLTDRSPAPVSRQAIGLVCFLLFIGVFGYVGHHVEAAYPSSREADTLPMFFAIAGSIIATYIAYRILRHFLHDRIASDAAPPHTA